MVMALTIRTASSSASAGGILVRATAPLVGAIAGVIGGSLLLFLVGKSLDGPILHVSGKILHEGSTNWVEVFPDIFVGVCVLLLIRGREGQEDGLCKLIGIRLRELGPKQATIEESEESGSAVECDVGGHPHWATALAEPTDDSITEELLPGDLFQEESNTVLKLLVGELGRLVVVEVRIDALGIEHLVPLGCGGDTESEGKQVKVRRTVLTLACRQLRLGLLLLILIPGLS
jgi:hypothetical protein